MYFFLFNVFDNGRLHGRFWENAILDQAILKVGKV